MEVMIRSLTSSSKLRLPVFALVLSLAILCSLIAGCNRRNTSTFHLASTSDPGTNSPNSSASGSSATLPVASYADIVSRVAPAVVTIHSTMRVRQPQQYPFMNDPFFQQFFGNRGMQQPPIERRREALGSGVIVTQDGYILTNHHVIDGADQIKIDLNDNRTLDAKVIGSDAPSDLAVLKINASGLPVLALGDSDRTRIGDVVLAIGDPLGIGPTVTT